MRKLIVAIALFFTVGFLIIHWRAKPVQSSKQQIVAPEQPTHPEESDSLAPSKTDAATPPNSPKTETSASPRSAVHEDKPVADHDSVVSVDTAGEKAFYTGDIANQMFELKELSANRPPPGPNEAHVFRGFIRHIPTKEMYIEMRFDRDKWIVSTGNSRNELAPWSRRDVIPFRNQSDLWTLYFENSEGLFLKYFPKVNIPELNGDFEVLSGWITTPLTLTHVAMIGFSDEWPPEDIVSRLFPKRPTQ